MINFVVQARKKEQRNTQYLPAEQQALRYEIKEQEGRGTIEEPFKFQINIENRGERLWEGVIHIQLKFPQKNPRFYLPAFMYGRNRGEAPLNVPNEFPRLREGEPARPASSWWMVRSDRLSHPCAFAYDNGNLYGLEASPYLIKQGDEIRQWKPEEQGDFYQYCGFTCSMKDGSVGYTLGYENAPWLFVKSHLVRERSTLDENCIKLKKGESIEVCLKVIEEHPCEILDVNRAIEKVYFEFHQKPRKGSRRDEAVKDLAEAIARDAYIKEEHCYAGQVFEQGDGTVRLNKIQSLSWTNGLAVSVPILMASQRLKNETMYQQSLDTIHYIVKNCYNPLSGLPFDSFENDRWSIHGWWFDGMHTAGHSGYIAGQAMYYLMKAYEFEKENRGILHKEWMELVELVLQQIQKTKNTDYEYPFILSEKTGAGIEYDSLGSCWCLAALSYYAYLTGDRTQLTDLAISEQHYYDTFISKAEGYGGPLDTDKATDSEGVLGYVRAVHYLHLVTKDDKYLKHLRDGLSYEFSFKFCYNSPVQTPPLGRLGWSSSGGSVTSVANPHIHPMSSTVVDEILYYLQYREDKYIESRLYDIIGWGTQTYNTYDKEYDYGKKGWMSERFCHSQGLLTQEYPDGKKASTWFCLMPWAGASIIEGLAGKLWDEALK